MNKRKILITGASGNVGKSMVSFLVKKDYNVLSLVMDDIHQNGIRGNLNDYSSLENACKNVEIIIHLAALIKGNKNKLIKVNIDGTKNLIKACKKNKVKKIIYMSSLDIKFNTPYGQSKKSAEKIVEDSGLDYIILRPSLIYGEDFDKGIVELKNIIKGHSVIPVPGNGENLFCPLYIDDLNSIVYQIINGDKFNGESYFVCGKEEISMNELIDLLASKLNKKVVKIHIPLKITLRILNLIGLHVGIVENAYLDKVESNEKIKRDFNFEPMGIVEGVWKIL